MNVNKIILIVGKSGSGKTTVANILEKDYGLKSINSYTTRLKRRKSEKGHIFLSEKAFEELMEKEKIVAFTEYKGNKYCATEEQIENNNIYIIDPCGIKYFKEHYTGKKKPIVIYINSSEELCKERMKQRGDTNKEIAERIKNDRMDFADVETLADIIIDNSRETQINTIAKKIWLEFIK